MAKLNLKIFILSLSIGSLIAAILTYFSGLPFWGALLIVLGAMLINGIIAEKEDNAPGGFLNPDGDNPKWPILVTFEDGSQEQYKNEEELECNLEFFNSDQDKNCKVTDANGDNVYLLLSNLKIKELKLVKK